MSPQRSPQHTGLAWIVVVVPIQELPLGGVELILARGKIFLGYTQTDRTRNAMKPQHKLRFANSGSIKATCSPLDHCLTHCACSRRTAKHHRVNVNTSVFRYKGTFFQLIRPKTYQKGILGLCLINFLILTSFLRRTNMKMCKPAIYGQSRLHWKSTPAPAIEYLQQQI